jgi:hypothetical protein
MWYPKDEHNMASHADEIKTYSSFLNMDEMELYSVYGNKWH